MPSPMLRSRARCIMKPTMYIVQSWTSTPSWLPRLGSTSIQGHGREQARSSGPGYNLDDLGESGELGLQHIANPKNKNNLAYYDETY